MRFFKLNSRGSEGLMIPVCVLSLTAIGCFFIYDFTVTELHGVDSGSYFLVRQIIFGITGMSIMFVVSRLDYHWVDRTILPIFTLLSTLVFLQFSMQNFKTESWFSIGLKLDISLLYVVISALVLAKVVSLRGWEYFPIFFGLCVFFLLLQRNFAGVTLFSVIAAVLAFLRAPKISTAVGFTILIAAFALLVRLMRLSSPVVALLFDWLNPVSPTSGIGSETVQSIYAIASGGLHGMGLGNGPAKYVLSDILTHHILSGIIQEIGIIGATILLLLQIIMTLCCTRIAYRASDKFGYYLSMAISTRFIAEVCLNIFMIVNWVPYTNFMFPFLSYGGSRLWVDCISMGVVLSVSRFGNTMLGGHMV